MTRTQQTNYGVNEIAELFPSLLRIGDQSLREKVAAVWNEAVTTGCGGKGWTFDELRAAGRWVKDSPTDAAELLKPIWGLDVKVILQANNRRSYDVRPVTKENMGEQQAIADAFFKEQVLPKPIDAKTAGIWQRTS